MGCLSCKKQENPKVNQNDTNNYPTIAGHYSKEKVYEKPNIQPVTIPEEKVYEKPNIQPVTIPEQKVEEKSSAPTQAPPPPPPSIPQPLPDSIIKQQQFSSVQQFFDDLVPVEHVKTDKQFQQISRIRIYIPVT